MEAFGLTDKGKVRKENQDAFIVEIIEERGMAVLAVCDGMGGARAGSVASKLGIETFVEHVLACLNEGSGREISDITREAASYANMKIYDRSYSDMSCRGMGTTLVGAIITDGGCVIVNVGDSRAYHISEGAVRRVTRDHSLVEDMVERGDLTREQAQTHPRKNLITRALGVEPGVMCDVFKMELKPNDLLLLCSDGLSNVVDEDELLPYAEKSGTPEELCRTLVDLTLERGAPDNVTVVVLAVS